MSMEGSSLSSQTSNQLALPIIFVTGSSLSTKPVNNEIMISAADVTTRAVVAMPWACCSEKLAR